MDRHLKGSYTVEMAMISGVWLLVVCASLFLLLGSYIKVCDTAKAYETAIRESTMAISKNQENKITVSFDKTFEIPYQKLQWRTHGDAKVKVIRPVKFIRKIQKRREGIFNGNRLQKKYE